MASNVKYRKYDPSLNTEPIEFLMDADEYYQDLLESLKGVTETVLFITGWVIRPSIPLSADKTLEDVIIDILMQSGSACYILWNSNITGPAPNLMPRVEEFRSRLKKKSGVSNIDEKLKIIISIDLQFDPGWKLSIANQASRFVPWGKPDNSLIPPGVFEKAQDWWEKQFTQKPASKYRNLRQFTLGSHHQKTVVISGKKQGKKVLIGYCGIDLAVGPGINWHDGGMRVRSDMALGLLENFIERWNFEIDRFDNIVSYGVTKNESLDKDTFFTEEKHPLADAIKTRRTMPRRVDMSPSGEYIVIQMAIRAWYKEILRDYLNYIKNAEQWLFIENQYFRHLEVASAVKQALDDKANLHVTIVLPAYSEEIGLRADLPSLRYEYAKTTDATKRSKLLAKAKDLSYTIDPFNKATLLLQTKCLAELVNHLRVHIWIPQRIEGKKIEGRPYIHTKLMVVDDKAIYIGSANVNGRSLDGYADSEINLLLTRKDIIDRIKGHIKWQNEPDSENDPKYNRWSDSDPVKTYYAQHNLARYTPAHWEMDNVFSQFPKGKANLIAYWETFNQSKSKRVDTWTPSLSKKQVSDYLDKLEKDMHIDLNTFDWGQFFIDNTAHLL